MEQYIPKSAVVAKIEKELDSCELIQMDNDDISVYEKGREDVCHTILSFLDTLEVKEVTIDEEIEKCLKKYHMLAVGKKDFSEIAKHFFELGIGASNKAWKGE